MKALLLIDIQKGLTVRALYEKEKFIETINDAIKKFRSKGDLVIFVQHENKQLVPNENAWELDSNLLVNPSDKIFSKNKGDAFTNTDLVEYLNENEITDIAVGGLVTHGCIKHTCLGGIKQGYSVSLLQGAHTNWAKDADDKIAATEKALLDAGAKLIDINNV